VNFWCTLKGLNGCVSTFAVETLPEIETFRFYVANQENDTRKC